MVQCGGTSQPDRLWLWPSQDSPVLGAVHTPLGPGNAAGVAKHGVPGVGNPLVIADVLSFRTGGGGLQLVLMRQPPQLSVKTWGGGQLGGGPAGGQGGVLPGVRGGLDGGQGGVQPGVRGGGLGLGLRSPSWWNQSWFYNPF